MTRTTTNRSFARQFNTAAFVALTAGVAFGGPVPDQELERVGEEESTNTTQPTERTLEPVVMSGDELAASGWSGWRVQSLSRESFFAVSPDGNFWMTTLRAADEFGNESELLIRGRGEEYEVIASNIEPWGGVTWNEIDAVRIDNDGSGETEVSRKTLSWDDLQRVDSDSFIETTTFPIEPHTPDDGAMRTLGTELERVTSVDMQALTNSEPAVRWESDDGFEYFVYTETEALQRTDGIYQLSKDKPLCVADFNGDSYADNSDIISYLESFMSGSSKADFNQDGYLDNSDINAFVTGFLRGC